MKLNKQTVYSYLRHVVALTVGAILTVSQTKHISVFDFSTAEWLLVANSLWIALFPVAQRAVSKSDVAFGVNAR